MGSKLLLFMLIFVLFSNFAIAEITYHSVEGHEEIVDIVYFYGIGCPHCVKLEEFLLDIEEDYI